MNSLVRAFQRIPPFPGKLRLGRRLFHSALASTDTWIEDREGNRFLVPSLQEPVGYHLFLDGVYEPEAIAFLRGELKNGGAFVDVGANIGAFTVPIAMGSGADRVLALEASPSVFPYLVENIRANRCSKSVQRQIAVTEVNNMTVPFYEAPADHFGMGSRAPQFFTDPIYVEGKTLTDILDRERTGYVAAIKIDVEGYEAGVFKGAEAILCGSKPPVLLFEFCDWAEKRTGIFRVGDAQRVLLEWGYELRSFGADGLLGEPLKEPIVSGFVTIVARRP